MTPIYRTPTRASRSRNSGVCRPAAAHRIEGCFEFAKGEAGLADYQVRNWPAWHHHQTLSLLAAWFLNRETRRGKNPDPRADDAVTPAVDRRADRPPPRDERRGVVVPPKHPLAATERACPAVPPPSRPATSRPSGPTARTPGPAGAGPRYFCRNWSRGRYSTQSTSACPSRPCPT